MNHAPRRRFRPEPWSSHPRAPDGVGYDPEFSRRSPGLSPSVLRRIEEGLSSISAADLLRVAAALDLDLHELLMEPRIQEHSDASRLIAAWLTINRARDRGAILAFLQTLGDR